MRRRDGDQDPDWQFLGDGRWRSPRGLVYPEETQTVQRVMAQRVRRGLPSRPEVNTEKVAAHERAWTSKLKAGGVVSQTLARRYGLLVIPSGIATPEPGAQEFKSELLAALAEPLDTNAHYGLIVSYGHEHYQAHCCSWRGPQRATETEASDDLDAHISVLSDEGAVSDGRE